MTDYRERYETVYLLCDLLCGAIDRHLQDIAPPEELQTAVTQARQILTDESED